MRSRPIRPLVFALAAATGLCVVDVTLPWLRAMLWAAVVLGAMLAIHELLQKPLPFLRWSFIRMGIGIRTLRREWQVGDGREERVARFVLSQVPANDIPAAIAAIDRFAYDEQFLINIGDEKGALLDDVIRRVQPKRVLEIGAYVGYSALRIARLLPPGGHVYSVEWSAANAQVARRIVAHAGAADRVTIVCGSLGDDGATIAELAATYGFGRGNVDVLFLDHDKDLYVPDFERILATHWLRPGSVVVADNVLFPGAPAYRAFIAAGEGTRWTTRVHETHAEYQRVFRDVVLESTMLDPANAQS